MWLVAALEHAGSPTGIFALSSIKTNVDALLKTHQFFRLLLKENKMA